VEFQLGFGGSVSRPLALDFRPRRRAGSWLGPIILLAGLIAAVAAAEHYRALERERDALEAGMRARTQVKPTARAGEAAAAQAQRRDNARRAVVRALGRPWEALLSDIEAAPAQDIALLAIEPDARRGEVRIAGEVRDAQALYRYIAELEATASLEKVGLTQHETLGEGAPAGTLRFVLIAHWQGVRR
jgi:hypothetical protein